MPDRCRILGCFGEPAWRGWMPKPGCRGHVLIPATVCASHKGVLVARRLLQPERLVRVEVVDDETWTATQHQAVDA